MKSGNENIFRDLEKNADSSTKRRKRSRTLEENEDQEALNLGVYRKSSILPILLSHAFVNQDKVIQDKVDPEENMAKTKFFRFQF